jgi:hypothetical protein
VIAAASKVQDWNRFMRIVRRHRVHALVNSSLAPVSAEVPGIIRAELSQEAANVARESLLYAAESARLGQILNDANIEFLFVKGASLAILAYGSLALKAARDIDLVVLPSEIVAASQAIAASGYLRITPGPELSDDQYRSWVQLSKESVWRNAATGVVLELHTGFVDSPMMLPALSVRSSTQWVTVAQGMELPTLARDELISYLCVHGATHAWSRLKWLADVHALFAQQAQTEVDRIYQRSRDLGAGRCTAQALLLCSKLFGLKLSPRLAEELQRDNINELLVQLALRSMAGKHVDLELDSTVFGTVSIHLSHFLLDTGFRYKASEIKRKIFKGPGRALTGLSRDSAFIYPLLVIPRWLVRRAKERLPG